MRSLIALAITGSTLALAGFQSTPARQRTANLTRGCVDTVDAAADYFPDKVTVEDAVNFSVTYHRSYKVVDVRSGVTGSRERYVLVQ